MTKEEFIKRFKFEPINDDMDRVNCPDQGKPLHNGCGVCVRHDKPRFMCGCFYQELKKVGQ